MEGNNQANTKTETDKTSIETNLNNNNQTPVVSIKSAIENPFPQNPTEKIINNANEKKSKLDTIFKNLIILLIIGTAIFILLLEGVSPCNQYGGCEDDFGAGGVIFLFSTLIVGIFLLIIVPILSLLPVKLNPTKSKTILKSPRYLGYLLLILFIIFFNIAYAYSINQSWKKRIEIYKKETEQRKIEKINYQNVHPEITRYNQRSTDQSLISSEIIEYKVKNNKLPENLIELRASGYKVPGDPLTGEDYKYFKNDTSGYFAVCFFMEKGKYSLVECLENGKSLYHPTYFSDDNYQKYADYKITLDTKVTTITTVKNDKRRKDTLSILTAIYRYKADHQGNLPKAIPSDKELELTKISNSGADLCSELVPEYLPTFPQDPAINNGKDITSCSSYDSGYEISKDSANKIFIYSKHVDPPDKIIFNSR